MESLTKIAIISLLFSNASALLNNDSEAYAYCASHGSSFVAIVWPLAQGKDDQIEKLLRKYGSIKYKKSVYFTYDQAYALLKDAHPHIQDMRSHMAWYFPPQAFNNPARVYLMTFPELSVAVKCKHAIRGLFNMGYSSIHINDYHHETLKLAQFFFGSRTKRVQEMSQTSLIRAYCACLCQGFR